MLARTAIERSANAGVKGDNREVAPKREESQWSRLLISHCQLDHQKWMLFTSFFKTFPRCSEQVVQEAF